MEHRGVSPDSSTHISEKSRKSKKRKHKQKSKTKHKKIKSSSSESNHNHNHKKSKKHKRSSKSPTHSEEQSDEEIFDIKPLSGYVDDRKELHKEIFSLVSKKEVKDLLPSSLKKLKFKEFKNLCLEQLEVMSQKRLRHVIAGQEMVSSSSDESETKEQQTTANQEKENEAASEDVPQMNEQAATANTRQVADEQPSKVSILEEMSMSPNQDEIDELIEPVPVPQLSQQPLQVEEQDDDKESPTQVDDQSLVMAEAELRELEFRARALKSLVIARERQQNLEKQKENEKTA